MSNDIPSNSFAGHVGGNPSPPAAAHIFEGKPDARQMTTPAPVSRFRPRYRALSEAEKALHDALKAKADELCALIETIKLGRYRALAITSLEESIMWAVKELTS